MTEVADPRPTVLLTGFGPFPGVPENASADLVEALAREASRRLPRYDFVSAVLATEWAQVPRLVAALHERHRPVLVLHFGVAKDAEGFRIETLGRNLCRLTLDAAGALPASACLAESGPALRPATIAAAAIVRKLKAKGYAGSLSDDAGGYLCNAVLYHSLACTEGDARGCRVGFIHIPADLRGAFPDPEYAVAGALEIVRGALELEAETGPLTCR